MKESTFFFRKFLHGKRKVGSILPSSRFLTQAMMKMIPFNQINMLFELGGGTGALTKELIQRKRKETTLVVFEPDEEFAQILEKKFSGAENVKIIRETADDMESAIRKFNLPKPDCVISSLPFTLLGEEISQKILKQLQFTLAPEGLFLLYQYTVFMLPLILRHFEIKRFSFVPLNLPPALVFLCAPRAVH